MLAVERVLSSRADGSAQIHPRAPWRRVIGVLFTFHFVCLCWIFFRADNAARAADFLAGLSNWSQPATLLTPFLGSLIAFGLLIQFTSPELLQQLDRIYHRIPTWAVGVLTGIALLLIEVVGGDSSAPFIYFQF
jgi:hypothetical protein